MSRALRQIVMMRATIMTNTFLYYLKRLWLIGKLVPDRVYGNPDFKIVLAVLFTIVGQGVSLTLCTGYGGTADVDDEKSTCGRV